MWISLLLLAAQAVHSGPGSFSVPDPTPASETLQVASATLYEINVRQFSERGDFAGVRSQLPRLADLGVDVLWLMPIHPIGKQQRKGTEGSYYAVADYTAVNPEYGTPEQFRALVDEAHARGMHVVLDWVANHTAWDHVWTESHPEFYTRGEDGGFTPPNPDWSDVIDLDYDQPGVRRAMTDAMLFWVREFGVDGFRCDVAEMVPRDFWRDAIAELRAEKPLFMLAEGQDEWLYEVGFDATYGWGIWNTVYEVVAGTKTVEDLLGAIARDQALHERHPGKYRIHFTSNHDWNSWHGLATERLGAAWDAATVLSFVLPGMPLIYGGQEAGLEKQLEFFERDPIEWRRHPSEQLYRALNSLKERTLLLDAGRGPDLHAVELKGENEGVVRLLRIGGAGFNYLRLTLNLTSEPVVLGPEYDGFLKGLTDLWGYPNNRPTTLEPWGWHLEWQGWER